jgi:hypothetical protein
LPIQRITVHHFYLLKNMKAQLPIFAVGRSYTTSSCSTSPGPEGSKDRRL